MQQFYDDAKTPTSRNIRIMNAAYSLGYLLAKLDKEIPEHVTAANGDEFTSDQRIEAELLKELTELIAKDPKRANEILDEDSDSAFALRTWWSGYHEAHRDYSVEAVRLMRQLKDADGNVAVYHEAGVCTHWINRGTQSWPDPDSRVNNLSVPMSKFEVRTGTDAGGEFKYLTYPSSANFHNIVRVRDGKLVAGEAKRPNWMY
ncbi:hypothetical protein D3C85_239280 [compost metagenome]